MKQLSIILLAISFFFSGCNEIDKLTQFNMDYDASVVIHSTTVIDLPIDLLTPDIESNSESQFAVNDTRKDLVERITLKSMQLSLTSPAGEDFSFLNSIRIYIAADGLEETQIAWKEVINEETVLDLETSDSNLQEYIKKDKFSLRVNTVTDEILTQDHHIDIKSVFFVDAKILGI